MPVKRSDGSELAYTTRKIEASFSNFSAWHQRSKVFDATGNLKGDKGKSKLDEEFELVNQAMYTMPDDQSAWLYHRWLIAQSVYLLIHLAGFIRGVTLLHCSSHIC